MRGVRGGAVAARRLFSGVELDADRFTCSPHGTYLTMNAAAEAGGKGGESAPHSSTN